MHKAGVVVGDFARGDDLVGVHHDADEAGVVLQAEVQHRQARLRGHGDRDVVGDFEAARAAELLLVEEQAHHLAQACQFVVAALCDEG